MYGALSTTVKFGSQVVQKTAGSISPRALITSTWDKSITSHSLEGFSSIFVNILGLNQPKKIRFVSKAFLWLFLSIYKVVFFLTVKWNGL